MFERTVTDASPLIIFQRIGQIDLLEALLRNAFIPPAVRREVYSANVPPAWIQEQSLTQPLASQIIAGRLGAGEREAIALALEIQATCLVLDDLPARRIAQLLHLTVIGSMGLLLQAKHKGLIGAVKPLIEEMQKTGFRVSEHVVTTILMAANEATL